MKRVPHIQRKRRSYWQNWVDEVMEDNEERTLKGIIEEIILKKGSRYVPNQVRLSNYLRSNKEYTYYKPKQYTIFRRVN